MKVWVVEAAYDYEDYMYTLGLFSSDEKARTYLRELKNKGQFPYDSELITPHVLDNPDA